MRSQCSKLNLSPRCNQMILGLTSTLEGHSTPWPGAAAVSLPSICCTMYNEHPRPKHNWAGTTRRRQLTGQQSDCCRVPSRAGSSLPGLPRTLSPCSSTLGTWSPGTAADWRRQTPCTGELTTSQSVFTIIVAGKQLP